MKFIPACFLHFTTSTFLLCSCSKWTHEHSMEVNMPIEKTWENFAHPNEWPILSDKIEYYHCEDDELKVGAIIQVKLKNIDSPFPILVTEVEPYRNFNTELKISSWNEKTFTTLEEITPEKTRINTKKVVQSFFLLFINKSYLSNEMESHYSMAKILLDQKAAESQEVNLQCF